MSFWTKLVNFFKNAATPLAGIGALNWLLVAWLNGFDLIKWLVSLPVIMSIPFIGAVLYTWIGVSGVYVVAVALGWMKKG